MRLLVIEDDEELGETIVERLRVEGHAVDRQANGVRAGELLRLNAFDLVILDIELPGRSGIELLRAMRLRRDTTPVLILTARSEIDDRVSGLDAGADDFMVKPFDFRELAARCRVLGRRQGGRASDAFVAGELTFDRRARRALVGERDAGLRHREVQLLEVFCDNLGRVLAKEELADRLYTFDETPSLNAVEQLVTRLRKRLEGTPLTIRTLRGLGYLAYVEEDGAA